MISLVFCVMCNESFSELMGNVGVWVARVVAWS